jgi:hypothetical protein
VQVDGNVLVACGLLSGNLSFARDDQNCSVHVMQFQRSVYKADAPSVSKGVTPNDNPDTSPK